MQTPPRSLRFPSFVSGGAALALALIAAPVLSAAACADNADKVGIGSVIRLDDDGLTPSVDDIRSHSADPADVDIAFDTFNGDTADFTSYSGTPLVINFFARSCPPCVFEMPLFESASEAFAGTVNIVGISVDASREDAEWLISETGVTYDLGWDPGNEVFRHFGALVLPATVFVSSQGTVQEVWAGVLTAEALETRIANLT